MTKLFFVSWNREISFVPIMKTLLRTFVFEINQSYFICKGCSTTSGQDEVPLHEHGRQQQLRLRRDFAQRHRRLQSQVCSRSRAFHL